MERSISAMIQSLFTKLQSTSKHKEWDIGLTTAQMRALRFIWQRSDAGLPTYQKDIEREFGIKGSSATSLLNNLEKNDWIRRESVAHDARLKSIVFAPRVAGVISQLGNITGFLDKCLRSSLTDEEFTVFCRCMEKMQEAIEDNREEISGGFDELVRLVRG